MSGERVDWEFLDADYGERRFPRPGGLRGLFGRRPDPPKFQTGPVTVSEGARAALVAMGAAYEGDVAAEDLLYCHTRCDFGHVTEDAHDENMAVLATGRGHVISCYNVPGMAHTTMVLVATELAGSVSSTANRTAVFVAEEA